MLENSSFAVAQATLILPFFVPSETGILSKQQLVTE